MVRCTGMNRRPPSTRLGRYIRSVGNGVRGSAWPFARPYTTARAVVAARGGYGATRICHLADFDSMARHPKWLVGFSDVTALHLEALRVGVASLHGPNFAALGRADEDARSEWVRAL